MKAVCKTLIILIITFTFSACTRKEEKLFHITYKLTFLSENIHPVFIAYKDSKDYVILSTNKDWSKEVLLPYDALASLLIIPRADFIIEDKEYFDRNGAIMSGQIIYKDRSLTSYGKFIEITSFVLDI
ncbi:MAG: hypothetical protein ACK5KL_02815 [Dysgonomonas sp.]|jgi:hypothetical protein|nr:hypothetical protein [Prevotella sp.]MDR3057862.1 hypothetical protein [Prevotella sp.]